MNNSSPQLEEPAESFTQVAPYYDDLMKGVPYRAWVRFVLALAERHGSAPETILDLACGTGSVSLLLAARGHRVVGIDSSGPMLQVAEAKAAAAGLDIPFIKSDLRDFTAPGPFDVALCLYDSLNNILEPEGIQQTFHCVRRTLDRDSLFIFDVNTDYALRANFFTQQNLGTSDPVQYRWKSQYDYGTRICTVNMEFWVQEKGERRHFTEIHRQRAYSLAEIERMLDEASLELVAAYDGLSFRQPHRETDRMYCVVRPKPLPQGDNTKVIIQLE